MKTINIIFLLSLLVSCKSTSPNNKITKERNEDSQVSRSLASEKPPCPKDGEIIKKLTLRIRLLGFGMELLRRLSHSSFPVLNLSSEAGNTTVRSGTRKDQIFATNIQTTYSIMLSGGIHKR